MKEDHLSVPDSEKVDPATFLNKWKLPKWKWGKKRKEVPHSMHEILEQVYVSASDILKYKAAHPEDVEGEERVIDILRRELLLESFCRIELFEACLKLYPNCYFKEDLQRRIEWEELIQYKSLVEFMKYQMTHPNSLLCNTEEKALALYAVLTNQVAEYFSRYPDGDFVEYFCYLYAIYSCYFAMYYENWPEGKYVEDCYFHSALRDFDFKIYLDRYPEGKYVDECLRIFEASKVEGTVEYRRMRLHNKIEEEKFYRSCKKKGDLDAYLERYPKGDLIKRDEENQMNWQSCLGLCLLSLPILLLLLIINPVCLTIIFLVLAVCGCVNGG